MNEIELGRMIVRLVGDASLYQSMLNSAQSVTQRVTATIAAASDRVRSYGASLNTFAGNLMSALGSFGLFNFQNAIQSGLQAENQIMRLSKVIEINGGTAREAMSDYDGFTRAVIQNTLLTARQVRGLLEQAEMLGYTGEQAKRVALNTISLARGNELFFRSNLRFAASMEQGNASLLRRMPGLRGIKNEQELFAKANKIVAGGLEIVKAESESSYGSLTKLGRAFFDVSIMVSQTIFVALKPFIQALTQMVEWFQHLDPPIQRLVVGMSTFLVVLTSSRYILALLVPFLRVMAVVLSPAAAGILMMAAALGALADQAGGISNLWDAISENAEQVWDNVKQDILGLVTWLKPLLDDMAGLFKAMWGEAKRTALAFIDGAIGAIGSFASYVKSIEPILTEIRATIGAVFRLATLVVLNAGEIWAAVWGGLQVDISPVIELVTDLTKRVYAWGKEMMTAAGTTVIAAIYSLYQGFKLLLSAVTPLANVFTDAGGGVVSFARNGATTIGIVLGLSAVIYGLIKVGFFLAAVMEVLKVKQIIMMGLNVAWAAAMLGVKAVVALFGVSLMVVNAVWAVFNLMMVTAKVSSLTTSAGMGILKGVVWLLNVALTAANIQWAMMNFLAAAFTGIALAGAFTVVVSAAYGIYQAIKSAIDVLTDLPSMFNEAAGPIAFISSMLMEWYEILLMVVKVSQVNMPIAWEILKAGFALAISQIRDLWPPLWEFIRSGWQILGDLVSIQFQISFEKMTRVIARKMFTLFEQIDPTGTLSSMIDKRHKENLAILDKDSDEVVAITAERLRKSAESFKIEEGEDTKAARVRVEIAKIAGELALKAGVPKDKDMEELKKQYEKMGLGAGQVFSNAATKEAKKFQAALVGSAEAMTRLLEYQDRLNNPGEGSGMNRNGNIKMEASEVGSAAALAKADRQITLLEEIRNALMVKVPAGGKPAGFGAGGV